MICGICKNTLLISEGIAEMNNKKYHMSCKLDFEKIGEKSKVFENLNVIQDYSK